MQHVRNHAQLKDLEYQREREEVHGRQMSPDVCEIALIRPLNRVDLTGTKRPRLCENISAVYAKLGCGALIPVRRYRNETIHRRRVP